MTYIDFFDTDPLHNICGCLAGMPEEVIFIGSNAKRMERSIQRYREVFAGRGYYPSISCYAVGAKSEEEIVSLLSSIVDTREECSFGLTGGEELLLVAMGAVVARYAEKGITIQRHRINLRNGRIYDCDSDGRLAPTRTPMLTVRELILIGGGISKGGDGDSIDMETVERLWDVCKRSPTEWNRLTSLLASIVRSGEAVSPLEFCASIDGINASPSFNARALLQGTTARLLEKTELVAFFAEDGTVGVSFRDAEVKACLTKAGMVLERKIYATAVSLREKDGSPLYNDAKTGVFLDWNDNSVIDTMNEVDVLLMKGLVSVFISCKNGDVDMDELYKLDAVARRFGGEYAKRVLVLSGSAACFMGIAKRAEEMHIRIIDNLNEMTDAALSQAVENLWKT